MTIMQIINMSFMFNCRVSTSWAVLVLMAFMNGAGCHNASSSS
jgi:hypothetical protein